MTATIADQTYFFEAYTKATGGSIISVGFIVNCRDRDDAAEKLKGYFGRKFDEVIQLHESNISPLAADKTHIIH